MGIFKKALARMKEKSNERRERRVHRRNAGDRHQGRKAARIARREEKRKLKHERKLEKIALRKGASGTKFNSFMEKVGPIVGSIIGRKDADTGEVNTGEMDENGNIIDSATGDVIRPGANDTMYMDHATAQRYTQAGGNPVPHNEQFVDEDGDGYDDVTGLDRGGKSREANEEGAAKSGRTTSSTSASRAMGLNSDESWTKQDGEGWMDWYKRLWAAHILAAVLVTLFGIVVPFVLIVWGIIELVKMLKRKKRGGMSWGKK